MAKDTFDFGAEFEAAELTADQAEMAAEIDQANEDNAEDKVLYTLKDGSQGSRAAYVRELFLEDNLSRKEIAEQTGIPYRAVYSATVNMVNDAEPTGRGRSVVNAIIKVDADNRVVQTDNGVAYVLDETGEKTDPTQPISDISRNDWIKAQVEAGVSRGDIAKALDLSYGVIYNLTKELEGTRAKHNVELEDGTIISRSAYIRQLAASGMKKGDIAKLLDVPYPVVWQATKTEKSATDKYKELIADLKEFTGLIPEDLAASFTNAVALLESIEIANPQEDESEEVNAE